MPRVVVVDALRGVRACVQNSHGTMRPHPFSLQCGLCVHCAVHYSQHTMMMTNDDDDDDDDRWSSPRNGTARAHRIALHHHTIKVAVCASENSV